jgi:DNA polymerase-1
MRYETFDGQEHERYQIALLVPRLDIPALEKHYLTPYLKDRSQVIAFTLEHVGNKAPVKDIKAYYQSLLPVLAELKIQYLIVADAACFKVLCKVAKAEAYLGYVLEVPGTEFRAIYAPSVGSVFYDPEKNLPKIGQAFRALLAHQDAAYQSPGTDIIHFAAYPSGYGEIHGWLQQLLNQRQNLASDIEGFSLKHYDAGIGTITFCWSQHEGIAFPVDYAPFPEKTPEGFWGEQVRNEPVRELLRYFFIAAKELGIKFTWHNGGYDIAVLIFQLFMRDILDTEGLLYGLEILAWDFDDTKLITYLATNSCAGNKLGLKDQAQEFAGNYAVESITDIRRIPLDQLLQYNLVDGLSTNYVYEKHWNTLIQDQQLEIYETLFKPALIDIIQMQLTGLPVNRATVAEKKAVMEQDRQAAMQVIEANPHVLEYQVKRVQDWVAWKNATLKKKRVTWQDAKPEDFRFNPNSDPQLRELLYERLGFRVLEKTDSGLPGTGKDAIKGMLNQVRNQETADQFVVDLLEALVALADVEIILTTFIPALESSVLGPDGWHYLFGNFNLGGTVSGRLSSSNPNLQNLPANSKYAKLIKECIQAPPGWLFCGLDFASLEDRISALTTKDPNKLKVYTDGYDGHCLRAVSYFGENMPDINPTDVTSVNSFSVKGHPYGKYRQESKTPTFLLTYGGTWRGIMQQMGWPEEKAKQIEARYHDLYVVSDDWIRSKLDEASRTGYITAAFGLRVRTPLLKQVVRGSKKTPYEAEAEGRTAGNALGQSWCLLNSRAVIDTMRKVRASQFRLGIRPCAQIHDASYYLVRDDYAHVLFLNTHLVQAANWNNHPDIYHPEVGLGGELSIFYPSWAQEMGVPNHATEGDLAELVTKHFETVTKIEM